ncbi:MAG: hypothetical protein DRQ78_08915 [Epsilonproteobacteria bacterium]|nr:MAG: hypothetical protein DRQ78_08915 [Campylobacterota bacterium]
MKKSIYVLLLILLVLIVACVYQKTYTLTNKSNAKPFAAAFVVEKEMLAQDKIITIKENKNPTVTKLPSVPSVPKPITPIVVSTKTSDSKPALVSASKETGKIHNSTKVPADYEEEIAAYLVRVLEDRDLAMQNRDKIEQDIQTLVKKALDDRIIVIQNRKKEELALQKMQDNLVLESQKQHQIKINTTGE